MAIVRGAFEYQGHKCSAASRLYVAASVWPALKKELLEDLASITTGSVEDFSNFVNAVIDENVFDKLVNVIKQAENDAEATIIAGGGHDKSGGYFIEPTIIETTNPQYVTMREELFGTILTVFVYADDQYEETLRLADKTSVYALTGSVIATDRYAIERACSILKNAAGNFYINDKCTGAVVGQQPFGGARASGTNDKAGSMINLLRWVSPRIIKETFNPPVDYRYPAFEADTLPQIL